MGVTASFQTDFDVAAKTPITVERDGDTISGAEVERVIRAMLEENKQPTLEDFTWAAGRATEIFTQRPNCVRV